MFTRNYYRGAALLYHTTNVVTVPTFIFRYATSQRAPVIRSAEHMHACISLALGFENHIDDMSLHDGSEGLDWGRTRL